VSKNGQAEHCLDVLRGGRIAPRSSHFILAANGY